MDIMRTRHHHLFTFLLCIFGVSAQGNVVYKLCVTENQATTNDCNILKRTGSSVNCVKVIDSIDCALKLERGEADFGIFTAEEAMLMSKFDYSQQRKVIAEIRDPERAEEKYKFQTVAIVKRDFVGPITNLKGRNFCHPGFSKSQMWTDRVLKHFERVVTNRSVVCDKASRSAVENELSALSSFFGKACRPGDWVPNEFSVLDTRYKKQQYSNLCALCDNYRGCSYNPQSDGNQFAALDCLTKSGGDVAYVSLFYSQKYFGTVGPQYRSNLNSADYRYLCPNGTVQNLPQTQNPCAWIAQPWEAVIARSEEISTGLSIELETKLATTQLRRSDEWVDTLSKVMLNDNRLVMRKDIIGLRTYIEEGREIPQAGTTLPCQQPIKWCTISDKDKEKCEWLRQAGIIQGVVPELECVQATSKLNCFQKIKDNEADIMGIDTNLGTIASHYFNLTTSLYQETVEEGQYRVVAVVKNDIAAKSLEDLKDKNGCFPEFGGLSWTAFINQIEDSRNRICPFDNSSGNFFKLACVPSAAERLGSKDATEQNKFCKLCSDAFSGNQSAWVPYSKEDSCKATTRNQFYGDAGALRCLGTGVADFAIVNNYNLSVNLQDDKLPNDFSSKYSIMCKNGTLVSLSKKIDNNCAIITVPGGEMIARRFRSKSEAKDLAITLQEFADWFGDYEVHYENIFHMFKPFDGVKNLLFNSEVLDLITVADSNQEHFETMMDYANLKNKAETCEDEITPDGAPIMEVQISTIIVMLLVTVLQVIVLF